MFKKICSAILAVVFLAVPAFSEEQDKIEQLEARIAELEQENQELRALLSAEDTDRLVAAKFNGGVITVAEAKAEYDYRAYFYQMLDMDASEYADMIKEEVLQNLTEDAVLKLKAQELGVYEPTEEQKAEIAQQAQKSLDDMIEYYLPYLSDADKTDEENRDAVIAYLENEDTTLESLTESLSAQAWRDRLMEAACEGFEVSDEVLESYYQSACETAQLTYSADIAAYETDRMNGEAVLWNPEGVRAVKRLLIAFDDAAIEEYQALSETLETASGEAEVSSLLEQLDALYATLDPVVAEVQLRIDSGDDFNLLIDEYGEDAYMREAGHEVGYYVVENSILLDAEFVSAALALENIGDITGPIQCADGVYFLYYEKDVPAGAVPFADFLTDDTLRLSIVESAREEYWYEVIAQWVSEAEIVYYPENF